MEEIPIVRNRVNTYIDMFEKISVLAGSKTNAYEWLMSPNTDLGAAPASLLQTTQGFDKVRNYVNWLMDKEG